MRLHYLPLHSPIQLSQWGKHRTVLSIISCGDDRHDRPTTSVILHRFLADVVLTLNSHNLAPRARLHHWRRHAVQPSATVESRVRLHLMCHIGDVTVGTRPADFICQREDAHQFTSNPTSTSAPGV